MDDETLQKWFREELLPAVINNGRFVEKSGSTVESCEFETAEKYVSGFSSAPSFAKIKINSQHGTVSRNVFIKFQVQSPILRQKMQSEPQFENEANFNNQVMPCFEEFLKSCDETPDFIQQVVPKCYYASDGEGVIEKGIVLLEDLRSHGFRSMDSPTDMDYDHLMLALERLARLHSVSFAMKYKKWQPLEKLKTIFKDVIVRDDPICREISRDFLGNVCLRGIDYLLSQKDSEVPKEYLEKLKTILKPTFEFQRNIFKPPEPLSVICHGDFNRNNFLFKYENGKPVDAILIDFQRMLYGSPSLDLGFIIYMNTTLQFREKYYDEIFHYYYNTLVKYTSRLTHENEKTIADWMPIRAFEEDFGKTALYHYIIISFFLPMMMLGPDDELEDRMANETFKESAVRYNKMGDEAVTKRISDVLVDMYRRKFYL